MPAANLNQPDSYFRTENLIAEWDKISFADVKDPQLRSALNILKEASLNNLTQPKSGEERYIERPYLSRAKEIAEILMHDRTYILLDNYYEKRMIPPHLQKLCDRTISLYLESYEANSTLEERLKLHEFKQKGGHPPSSSGLGIIYRSK